MAEEDCKVHGIVLKSDEVPIHYGFPFFDEEQIEAGSKLFPNAKTSVLGGCMVDDSHYKAEILFCE